MPNLRNLILKLAKEVPETRRHLIPIFRQAMEFDTPEALEK